MTPNETLAKLLDYTSSYVSLEEDELNILQELTQVKTYQKGELLLSAGEVSKSFFFNASGLVRLYYLIDGEERTAFFYDIGSFINPYASFRNQEPSQYFLQAIEPTSVVVFGYESTEKLLTIAPKFEILARRVMEEELMVLQEIVEWHITLNPEARYNKLLATKPDIFQKVTQTHIASFLGVKPESLSRIKKRSMDKG